MMSCVVVEADQMVRFIFNDGIPPTRNNECTDDDDQYLDQIFNINGTDSISLSLLRSRRLRRQLVSSSSSYTSDAEHPLHRALRNYPPKCKDNCRGYSPGTCRASVCQGYSGGRRIRGRGLGDSIPPLSCDAQIATMNAALDQLISSGKLSLSCQGFARKEKRTVTCLDDVIYGEVDSFSFWNMGIVNVTNNSRKWVSNATKIYDAISTYEKTTICSTVRLNIQAELNPCVISVNYTVTGGPKGDYYYNHVDNKHPMYVFGPKTDINTTSGRRVPPGLYTVKAVPDNFSYKEKTLHFEVLPC